MRPLRRVLCACNRRKKGEKKNAVFVFPWFLFQNYTLTIPYTRIWLRRGSSVRLATPTSSQLYYITAQRPPRTPINICLLQRCNPQSEMFRFRWWHRSMLCFTCGTRGELATEKFCMAWYIYISILHHLFSRDPLRRVKKSFHAVPVCHVEGLSSDHSYWWEKVNT